MEKFFSKLFRNHGKLPALFELVRPWNAIVSGFVALFGSLIVGEFSIFNNIILFITFTLGYMGGTTINDLMDEFADEINMPYRPIPANRLGKKEVLASSFLLHLFALIFALYLGPKVVILLILFFLFSFMYSTPPIRFSKRGVLSQIELSATVVSIPMYAGMVFGSGSFVINFDYVLLIILFTLFFIFVFMLKDFKDIKGDRADNKKTVVLQLGRKKNTKIIIVREHLYFVGFNYILL